MYRGGLGYMRHSVSDTAEWGDYTAGPRIVTDETKAAMARLLAEIRDGSFAARWIAENETGRPEYEARRKAEREHPIEAVGARPARHDAVPRRRRRHPRGRRREDLEGHESRRPRGGLPGRRTGERRRMSGRVLVFDTTLRDGEQSPGCSMHGVEKVRLARQLERLGVDVIEAGFPAASVGERESVRAVANEVVLHRRRPLPDPRGGHPRRGEGARRARPAPASTPSSPPPTSTSRTS